MADTSKKFKISVSIGQKKLLIPATSDNNVQWLIEECTRRFKKSYPGVPIKILRLKTAEGELFDEDNLGDVIDNGTSVIAITPDNVNNNNDPLTDAFPVPLQSSQMDPLPLSGSTQSTPDPIVQSSPVILPNPIPPVLKRKRENSTNFCVEFRTVDGETKEVFDLTEDSTLEDLSKAIVLEEGKDPEAVSTQMYTLNYPLMPIGGSQKMSLKQWGLKNKDLLFVTFVGKNIAPYDPDGWESVFAMTEWWKPAVVQTEKGMSSFLSALYVVVSSV